MRFAIAALIIIACLAVTAGSPFRPLAALAVDCAGLGAQIDQIKAKLKSIPPPSAADAASLKTQLATLQSENTSACVCPQQQSLLVGELGDFENNLKNPTMATLKKGEGLSPLSASVAAFEQMCTSHPNFDTALKALCTEITTLSAGYVPNLNNSDLATKVKNEQGLNQLDIVAADFGCPAPPAVGSLAKCQQVTAARDNPKQNDPTTRQLLKDEYDMYNCSQYGDKIFGLECSWFETQLKVDTKALASAESEKNQKLIDSLTATIATEKAIVKDNNCK
ncbi:MAG: hypothetical protein JO092_00880, partial [Candidatus Eremiobacteraeota bacterium]|nr:hypothetical protein [Candidatus Eremiobacteraeota bacterium]